MRFMAPYDKDELRDAFEKNRGTSEAGFSRAPEAGFTRAPEVGFSRALEGRWRSDGGR